MKNEETISATLRTTVAIARNMTRPGYARQMGRKAWRRFRSREPVATRRDGVEWSRSRAESLEAFATSLDAGLWKEAQEFGAELAASGRAAAAEQGRPFGGADYRLLYFLVRHLVPAEVVETGVAAGYSSAAILEAMHRNGRGTLHSSDLPYLRMSDPDGYIGCVVPLSLRSGWDLQTRGDRISLPIFADSIERVDLLHYDSDKSYEGRDFALKTLSEQIDGDTVLVFDDIQDNDHFKDWVLDQHVKFRVFEFSGKWVGVVGV